MRRGAQCAAHIGTTPRAGTACAGCPTAGRCAAAVAAAVAVVSQCRWVGKPAAVGTMRDKPHQKRLACAYGMAQACETPSERAIALLDRQRARRCMQINCRPLHTAITTLTTLTTLTTVALALQMDGHVERGDGTLEVIFLNEGQVGGVGGDVDHIHPFLVRRIHGGDDTCRVEAERLAAEAERPPPCRGSDDGVVWKERERILIDDERDLVVDMGVRPEALLAVSGSKHHPLDKSMGRGLQQLTIKPHHH
mmetsp:Transcript_54909/g.109026  ORF Transcript_54909/g.109026 Transcript_54909/m.109026 type:complete len:251 (-) Transcript_54909:171-923(-)